MNYLELVSCPWCGSGRRNLRLRRGSGGPLCTNPWHDAILTSGGWNVYYGFNLPVCEGVDLVPSLGNPNKEGNKMSMDRKIAAAQAAVVQSIARLEHLLAMPTEPDLDGENVIYFGKQFRPGSKVYEYAAIKASDGLWYTTGPNTPKGYTWDDLMTWLYSHYGGKPVEIWQATEFTLLGAEE